MDYSPHGEKVKVQGVCEEKKGKNDPKRSRERTVSLALSKRDMRCVNWYDDIMTWEDTFKLILINTIIL